MKDHCSEMRRQILEDVLGDNVEEYENFNKETVNFNKRQHRQRIPLWQFLLHLLNRDENSRYIEWNQDRALEFRIKDTIAVADLWGSVKNKTDMTYEKLGRAMRYYYGKSIIEKVSGRRYTYRFILSRRTKKYLSQFMNLSGMKLEKVDNIDDSASDSVVPDSRPGSPEDENDATLTESPVKIIKQTSTSVPLKVNPVKPTPQQTVSKTKIFKPEELLGKNFQPSFVYIPTLMKNENDLLSRDTERRSAFATPSKILKLTDGKTKIYKSMPLLDRMPSYDHHGYSEQQNVPSRKRKFYCSCDSSSCHLQYGGSVSDDNSECESYSYKSMSPQELTVRPIIKDTKNYTTFSRNDEFILRKETRRDLREKQERNIMEFQHKLKLNRRVDPFMGYYERCETLDDYIYETNHRRHAWAA